MGHLHHEKAFASDACLFYGILLVCPPNLDNELLLFGFTIKL